jgi:hypothetical protein
VAARKIVFEVDDRYVTKDLYLAAYLHVAGARLEGATRNGNAVLFTFSSPDMTRLRLSWYDGTGEVSACLYAAATQNLKSMAIDT